MRAGLDQQAARRDFSWSGPFTERPADRCVQGEINRLLRPYCAWKQELGFSSSDFCRKLGRSI
ncbi:MAG: hypothetical protein KTR25_13525 [Myxococcales bacterium]|nr:hypothetical protein [Myxococcales bacterium]